MSPRRRRTSASDEEFPATTTRQGNRSDAEPSRNTSPFPLRSGSFNGSFAIADLAEIMPFQKVKPTPAMAPPRVGATPKRGARDAAAFAGGVWNVSHVRY